MSAIGIVAVIVTAAAAPAAQVRYGPPAAWVAPPPASSAGEATDQPIRIVYADSQTRVVRDGEEAFTAYRLKILKPEGLPAGNISINWSPEAGPATVHAVRLIRGGVTTDVLAATKFRILEREAGLEQAALDGRLTAVLAVPGLQVGDEIEFAATVDQAEPAFGDHPAGVTQLPVLGAPGVFRYRLEWPAATALTWRASNDLPAMTPETVRGETVLSVELRDPAGAVPTEGAPPRYNVRRLIEYSGFATWPDVSRQMSGLFEHAAQTDSPELKAAAAAIAAQSSDPASRAEAALVLVEEQIRYVFVGLDGGNYVPATAAVTWQRRYGDCKAKTVVLLALLRALGIAAEPVLVNSHGGDGTDDRLPSPRLFDHVVVRATIDGKPYWLDSTRAGDRHLDRLPAATFRWALPLTPGGAPLLPVAAAPPDKPQFTGIVDLDASAGIDRDARIKAQNVLRGEEAYAIRTGLATLSAADADRALKTYWRKTAEFIDADTVSWRYDEREAALVLGITGHGKPEWEGSDADGRRLTIMGAGFYPPDRLKRPADQDQKAPWAMEFPRFKCWATTIRLPAAGPKWHWTYAAKPMDRSIGGAAYWRAAGMDGLVVRTVMSRRAEVPEISAAEAVKANGQIVGFDNAMSTIDQQAAATGDRLLHEHLPFADDADWVANPAACSTPVGRSPKS